MINKISLIAFLLFLSAGYSIRLHGQKQPGLMGRENGVQLLVRADDMGNSYGRTLGIIKAFKLGIVTSAGIMPTSPFFEESVRLCKENPKLVMGIHLTLLGTRTRPVLSPDIIPSIVTPEGFFYETLDQLNKVNPSIEEMEKEIHAQIKKVKATGLKFVYLDWHRSVPAPVADIINRICAEEKLVYGQDFMRKGESVYGFTLLPLMPETWPTQKSPDGQTVHYAAPSFTSEQQEQFFNGLAGLKPGRWIIMVHPGLGEPQRISVTELLCSPKAKEIIKKNNIQLVSYYDIWKEEFGKR